MVAVELSEGMGGPVPLRNSRPGPAPSQFPADGFRGIAIHRVDEWFVELFQVQIGKEGRGGQDCGATGADGRRHKHDAVNLGVGQKSG